MLSDDVLTVALPVERSSVVRIGGGPVETRPIASGWHMVGDIAHTSMAA